MLDVAARQGLVDLASAFARLKATSFYYRRASSRRFWRDKPMRKAEAAETPSVPQNPGGIACGPKIFGVRGACERGGQASPA